MSHYRSPLTYDEVTLDATGVALRAFSDAKWKLSERYSEMSRSMLEAQGIKTDNITPAEAYRNRFISAMDDDFNTAQAIAALFNLAQGINRAVNLGHADKVALHRKIFMKLTDVLGLILPEPEEEKQIASGELDKEEVDKAKVHGKALRKLLDEIERVAIDPNRDIEEVRGKINLVRGVRDSLRKEGQFKLADEIRDRLTKCGFTVTDTITGTDLTFKR
jgi:cysteinyl-tRNA synthetase